MNATSVRHRDSGSATVWAALASGVILAVGLVGIDLASAVRSRHVAEAAADLAALAAAGRSVEGDGPACAQARALARRSGAAVSACHLDGWDALVEVEVGRAWTMLGREPARARARAGPAPHEVEAAPAAELTERSPASSGRRAGP